MAVTFVQARIAAGAETVTDQLAGTAVAFAGPLGIVRAAFSSTLTTSKALLKGRNSGREIIPNNSFPNIIGPITAIEIEGTGFIFEGTVLPGEPLELTLIAGAAATHLVAVRTE